MGKNSQRRRAAKKRRDRQRQTASSQSASPGASKPRSSTTAIGSRVRSEDRCDCPRCRAERLRSARRRAGASDETVGPQRDGGIGPADAETNTQRFAESEQMLGMAIASAWDRGWQPAEVLRQVRRSVKPAALAADVVGRAIASDHDARSISSIHPAWGRQIERVRQRIDGVDHRDGWVARWAAGQTDEESALAVLLDVTLEMAKLDPLPKLIPPPGGEVDPAVTWMGTATTNGGVAGESGDPMLARIRSLLAKAEATEFPSEAEAFTAKAYDMMTKHAIDEAVLRSRSAGNGDGPLGEAIAVRIPVDEPYAKQHALLLSVVARASRCRAIYHQDWAMMTVMGSPTDVHRVELLYTSLMLQAQRALNTEAAASGTGSLRRSRGFRSAFLTGYAGRIGDRLEQRRTAMTADAPGSALPVLASDAAAAKRLQDDLFSGATKAMSFGRLNAAGLDSGEAAGNRAQLEDPAVMYDGPRRAIA